MIYSYDIYNLVILATNWHIHTSEDTKLLPITYVFITDHNMGFGGGRRPTCENELRYQLEYFYLEKFIHCL